MAIRRLPSSVVSSFRTDVTITSTPQCVTELVLNSIDAGATSISVRVDLNNFKIQVIDNGHGFSLTDLKVAGTRYMTSKCLSLDDLQRNLTHFGFRGEALASLSEVCGTLMIVSRPKGSDVTYCKLFTKGHPQQVGESRRPRESNGTTITVGDFLYNRPVRQAHVRPALDLEDIKVNLERIALINPSVSFSLHNDGTNDIVLRTGKTGSICKTFGNLFGLETANSLVPVRGGSKSIEIGGFISKEVHSSKNLQFIYVNKRLLLKTKLHKLLNSIMSRSSIMKNKSGPYVPLSKGIDHGVFLAFSPPKRAKHAVFILNIECPPGEYDITLDPKKTLIEFNDWDKVLSCLENIVRGFIEKELGDPSVGEQGVEFSVSKKQMNVLEEVNQLAREDALGANIEESQEGISTRDILRAKHSLPAVRNPVQLCLDVPSDSVLYSSGIDTIAGETPCHSGVPLLSGSSSVMTEQPFLSPQHKRISRSDVAPPLIRKKPMFESEDSSNFDSVPPKQTTAGASLFKHPSHIPPKQDNSKPAKSSFVSKSLHFQANLKRITGAISSNSDLSKPLETAHISTPINALASIKEIRRKNMLKNLNKFSYGVSCRKPQITKISLPLHKNETQAFGGDVHHRLMQQPSKPDHQLPRISKESKGIQTSIPSASSSSNICNLKRTSDATKHDNVIQNINPTKLDFSCQTSTIYDSQSELPTVHKNVGNEVVNCLKDPQDFHVMSKTKSVEETVVKKVSTTCSGDRLSSETSVDETLYSLSVFQGSPVIPMRHTTEIFEESFEGFSTQNINRLVSSKSLSEISLPTHCRKLQSGIESCEPLAAEVSESIGTRKQLYNKEDFINTADAKTFSPESSESFCHLCQFDMCARHLKVTTPPIKLVDYDSSSSSDGQSQEMFSLSDKCVSKVSEISIDLKKRCNKTNSMSKEPVKRVCLRPSALSECNIQSNLLGFVPDLEHDENQSSMHDCQSDIKDIECSNFKEPVPSDQKSLECDTAVQELTRVEIGNGPLSHYDKDKVLNATIEVEVDCSHKKTPIDQIVVHEKEYELQGGVNCAPTMEDSCVVFSSLPHSSTSQTFSSSCLFTSSEATDLMSGKEQSEWVQQIDVSGREFFIHRKSGVISYNKPEIKKEAPFTVTDRYTFLPKGMSPLLHEEDNRGTSCSSSLSDEKRKELRSILGTSGNQGTQTTYCSSEQWPLMDQLLSQVHSAPVEPCVPNATLQELTKSDVKIYNVIYPYTFSKEIFKNLKVLGQLDKKFIVTVATLETAKTVIVLFDQHAVHERIRVEKLTEEYRQHDGKAVWRSAPVEPALPLTLSPNKVRVLDNFKEKMQQLGLVFNVVDPQRINILRVPTCLLLREDREVQSTGTSVLRQHIESLIREQVDSLINTRGVGADQPAIVRNVISSEACKGALKFGDILSTADCRALLHNLSSCHLPFQCAHGRPALVPILDLSQLNPKCFLSQPNLKKLKRQLPQ